MKVSTISNGKVDHYVVDLDGKTFVEVGRMCHGIPGHYEWREQPHNGPVSAMQSHELDCIVREINEGKSTYKK